MNLLSYLEKNPQELESAARFGTATEKEIEEKLALFDDEPYHEASKMVEIESERERTGGLKPIATAIDFMRPKFFKQGAYKVFKGSLSAKDHSYEKAEKCKFHYRYYRSLDPASAGTMLLIIPPIQGVSFIEKNIAVHAVRNGTNCMILLPPENPTDVKRPVAHLESMQLRSIKSIKHMIDFCQQMPEINPNRIVASGISLGGNNLALALGVEPRIKAGITFVASGNFPDMLAYSNQFLAKRYRNARLRAENIESVEHFRAMIEEKVRVDAMYFAKRRKKEDIFMVIGRNDRDVLFKNQLQLWNAFGQPDHTVINRGHILSILRYPLFFLKTYEFLYNKLKKDSEHV